ncbi:MAG: UDP-3-O-acyl-N-acetylglucosamine deacetylase [Rickettsiales bacterium]|jgi:UDP-3-O-[3-hydroxymyristoyl] N-acetylglucosamine deacetylase|nr:UDP-3-O-acyl-N-acetylglucosamine deacetylase [Rickettsiales bacterium]
MKSKKIKISGVGIHSGLPSEMSVRLTKTGGIVFVRNGIRIPARYNVASSRLQNTTIGEAPNHVQTIEHFMAALFVCGIRNMEIVINNTETPVLDGSADKFIKILSSLKIKDKRIFLRVKKEIVAERAEIKPPLFVRIMNFIKRRRWDGYVKLSPVKRNVLEVNARLIYGEEVIGDQSASFKFDYNDFQKSAKDFVKKIAKSRTFGKISEWEWLKRHGMGRGANESNVIAIDESGTGALNKLYYPDEFVRHKIIDATGDLYTSGYSIIGKLESFKGSHALNNLVLRKLFSDPSNYDIIRL